MQTNNHKMMNKMIKVMKMQIKSDINVIILYMYYTEKNIYKYKEFEFINGF